MASIPCVVELDRLLSEANEQLRKGREMLKKKLITHLKKYRGSYATGLDMARLFEVRPSAVTNIMLDLIEDELVDTISIKSYGRRACTGYRWIGGKNES